MTGFVSIRIVFVLSAGALFVALQGAHAQQPRTRTLTYDPERKKWVEEAPPPAGTPAGDLHAVRLLIKDGRFRKALSGVKSFVRQYGANDPLYPEVLLAKAEALIGRGDYFKAHAVLQAFLSEFGGMGITSEALRLEFVIADVFLSGVKRKVWGIRLLSGTDIAYQILDEIAADYPDSRLAELALKTKADHLFKEGEHALAELEYARLLREYPQSRYRRLALRRSADAALAAFEGVDYDEAALADAQERYQEYRMQFPEDADLEGVGLILESIREMRARKDFSIAAYYERTGHVSSAVYYYRLVRENWPDSIAATRATERLEILGALRPVASDGTIQGAAGLRNTPGRSNR